MSHAAASAVASTKVGSFAELFCNLGVLSSALRPYRGSPTSLTVGGGFFRIVFALAGSLDAVAAVNVVAVNVADPHLHEHELGYGLVFL
ncbi:hypothetical protein AeRB84_004430 [Aphanomyces euteiches]|nr:hypothetical protein AeRB84_004430 [Aphanomyces euteiches]